MAAAGVGDGAAAAPGAPAAGPGRGTAAAAHDQYLEAKMRSVMEGLVEELLTKKPDDVALFCVEWLAEWHKERDPDQDELARLRAERDLLVERRSELRLLVEALPPEAAAEQQPRDAGAPAAGAGAGAAGAGAAGAEGAAGAAGAEGAEGAAGAAGAEGADGAAAAAASAAAGGAGDGDAGGEAAASAPAASAAPAAASPPATARSSVAEDHEAPAPLEAAEEAGDEENAGPLRSESRNAVMSEMDGGSSSIATMMSYDRRAGISAPAMDEDKMKSWVRPHYEKPPDVREQIKETIGSNEKLQVLFGHLEESSVYDVIDAMQPFEIKEGTTLITQGEEGQYSYIVETGTFDVFVRRGDGLGGKVMDYGPGAMFGELALMYNAPRAATVKATADAKVWALDRETFVMMLSTAENAKKSQYEEFLSEIPMLKLMTKYELCKLSDLLESELFEGDEELFKQGDEATHFYILEDGEAKAFVSGEHGEVEATFYENPGEMFGEVALLKGQPRSATVRAIGQGCTVLTLKKEDFEEAMGPVKAELEKHAASYPSYAELFAQNGAAAQKGEDGAAAAADGAAES